MKSYFSEYILAVHEWAALFVAIGVLLLLCFLSFLNEEFPEYPYDENMVEVEILGSVRYPGEYKFPKNTRMSDLLFLAEPTAAADLKKINSKALLRHGQIIRIKEGAKITVYLEGAVKKRVLELPKGTKVNELLKRDILAENGDPKILNKKRCLKDKEIICVEEKKTIQPEKKRTKASPKVL